MHKAFLRVVALTFLAGSSLAIAEIYETRDAEGNPVFSDTPSPESEVVDLPEANIADPVEEVPGAGQGADGKPAAPGPAPSGTGAGRDDQVILMGDEPGDDRYRPGREFSESEGRDEVLDAEPRDEVLDAEPRDEVLEAEPRHETSGAAPRREVLDAQPRHEVR